MDATPNTSLDDSQFAAIFNNVEAYPTLFAVGQATGLSYRGVQSKALRLRQAWRAGRKDVPQLISRVPTMSEDESRLRVEFTADDCIAELRRVAEEHPEMALSRNFFRNHGSISESTWTRYFGTFDEFKRQALITPTRQIRQLEKQIAKHASVDHYRRASEERTQWGDRYLRDTEGRWKTMIVASDLHDKEVDPFFMRVLVDTVGRVQPDVISLVGDIFDLPEFGKYTVDPREWDVVGRIKFAHDQILRPLRDMAPNAQIDFIEGNHEARLLKHLADATPAMRAVLSDLHGMSVSKLLGLDEFEVNYIAQADLGAYHLRDQRRELQKNYKVYWNAFMCHHFPHARNMGMPGVNGHHHRHEVWPMFNHQFGAYEWHQLGAGHKRSASYCEGEKWHNGFALVHVDTVTKASITEYVNVRDFAVVGGRYFTRGAGEEV